VIGEALQILREEQPSMAGTPNGAQREAVREMLAFVENNRVRLEGISVKELILEGHRLRVVLCWTLPWRFSGFWKMKQIGSTASGCSQVSREKHAWVPFH
jgi:hypothetical protein